MANWQNYKIKDDSSDFYLILNKMKYWVKDADVSRPDWDYRIEFIIKTEKGLFKKIKTAPLMENEFVGKSFSEIISRYQANPEYYKVVKNDSVRLVKPTDEKLLLLL